MERRDFLQLSALGAAGVLWPRVYPGSTGALEELATATLLPGVPESATDEAFWRRIRALYTPPTDYLDFAHANISPTSISVFDAFAERSRWLSQAPAERVFGTIWGDEDAGAYPALAALLGTQLERVAFMANSTTALNTILHGFPLERGDEILVTNHEYPDMVETILQRSRREGISMRIVPVPGSHESRLALVDRVAAAISPRTKLLLISHVSAWSGEILPVAEVTAAARDRGVAVLVDAAQSVGMLDVSFDAIGCDFLATSLHKWLGAPLASGALVMRPEHVERVWPLHPPSWDTTEYPMTRFTWTGTINSAAPAGVVDAIAFQRTLGADRKRARTRYLGDYWQSRLADVPKVRLLTPRDPVRSFGVASFMVEGVPSDALVKHLRQRKGLLVQSKAGRHSPFANAVRVSPGPYTTPGELDRLVAAVREVARSGIPNSE
ncbi:MAG TPA: aminotransferase class V-fold PLP-dependent enzyme [Gemmatimonadaceae bacterium]|nr:aminotransferase class V-fold PLP-dependent enzyme [Gemmatimonadaceae bacterium]